MTPLSSIYYSLVIFFPLWMQIWQSEPISDADFEQGGYYQVKPEVLDKVKEGLQHCAPDLRCRLLLELSEAQIPATQNLLLDWLQQESVPEIQASILSYLNRTDLNNLALERISAYLSSNHLQTQENAIILYGKLPNADFNALLPYLSESLDGKQLPLKIRRAAWRCFAENSEAVGKTLESDAILLSHKDDPSLEIQALALQTATFVQPRSSEIATWLDLASQSDNPLLRLAAAKDPQPESTARLQRLLQDREVNVRAAVCESIIQDQYQGLLLQSLKDPNSAVRLAAVLALRKQNALNNEKAILLLLDACSDACAQIRDESETTLFLCAQNQSGPAKDLLKQALAHSDALLRLHATRILQRLNETSAMPIIAANLAQEENSENLEAGIRALAQLSEPGSHADLLQSYAGHPSPLVRAAVATALGTLRTDNAESILEKLCLDPNSPEVRAAAFHAMGLFPKGSFAPSILQCLKNTGKTTSTERRNAAWASGKLIPENSKQEKQLLELAQRLLLQCTVPVIPGMEPMFEGIDVIANVIHSLMQMQKRFPEMQEIADITEKVLAIYGVPWEQAAANIGMGSNAMPPPVNATTNSMVNQARQWLRGEQPSTEPIPPQSLSFIYQ